MTDTLRTRPQRRFRRRAVKVSRHVCRIHALSLLRIAALILRDVDTASDIVADAIVAECRKRNVDPHDSGARARLAASVYRRCIGVLVARERFGPATSTPDSSLGGLTIHQRSAIALTLFGNHSVNRTAQVLRRPAGAVLQDLLAILDRTSTVDYVLPRQRARN
jgi:DNA-directed RNA polymerase specialized sigma24 family protein